MRNQNSGKNTDRRSTARRSGAHAAPAKSARTGRTANRSREDVIEYSSTDYDPGYSAPQEPAEAPVSRRGSNTARSSRAAAKAEALAQKEAQKAAKAEAKAKARDEKALKAALAKPARKAAFRRFQIAFAIILCLIALAAGGVVVAGHKVSASTVNLPNVYIGETAVGGLSMAETVSLLDSQGWDEANSGVMRVRLPAGATFKLDLRDAGYYVSKEAAAAEAFRYGHDGSWFSNLLCYIKGQFSTVDVTDSSLSLNEAYIRQQAQNGIDKFRLNTALKGEPYEVVAEEDLLRMIKGAGEMDIHMDALYAGILSAMLNGERELDYNHIDNDLPMPDFGAIHTALGREPENAYFVEGGFDVVDEIVGCDFNVQQAEQIWQAAKPGETVEIPLSITYPEITGNDLRSMLFRDRLGAQTTVYLGSTAERINNIHLATSRFNEMILMPGDEFSYNDIVGERTREAGFLPADAYSDGEVVQELGGGICQVSSTLYCAVRYAQLEVRARTNHYFKVHYLDYSMDATVSWGGPEFKFVNNRDYPIKILTSCDDVSGELTIEIWGTDVDGSYVNLPFERFMVFDDYYTDVVVGYAVQAYRDTYDKDGNLLGREKEPYGYSIYYLHDWDINWPAEVKEASTVAFVGGSGSGGYTGGGYTGGSSDDPYGG